MVVFYPARVAFTKRLIPEELVMCLFPLLIAQTSMVLVTIHTSIWIGMNAKLVR